MESTLRWADLRNPIYSRDQCSVRDACVVRVPDGIALFYSLFSIDHGRVRSRVEGVMTTDFLHYSEPLWQWDGPDYGWIGMCSPRIIQADGRWILTMNSCGDMPGRPDRLYFSESIDGHSWSLLQPLAAGLTQGTRATDASLHVENESWVMIFKNGDEPEAAISDGSIYGPWRDAGRPTSEWTEKAQFFGHGDETLLLAMTGGPDLRHPAVFRRERAGSLTRWIKDHDLDIPREKFNSLEIANAGVILGPETGLLPDQSADNQFFYFIYSGRTEDSSLAGQGDNRLGIARSVDLVHWEVPR